MNGENSDDKNRSKSSKKTGGFSLKSFAVLSYSEPAEEDYPDYSRIVNLTFIEPSVKDLEDFEYCIFNEPEKYFVSDSAIVDKMLFSSKVVISEEFIEPGLTVTIGRLKSRHSEDLGITFMFCSFDDNVIVNSLADCVQISQQFYIGYAIDYVYDHFLGFEQAPI